MAKRKNPRKNVNVKTEIANKAPAAEIASEAPAAEAASEAPAAEAVNEAPAAEIASEAPAVETASEAPATEAVTETPAESGVITVSIPGCSDRSYQFKPGITWGGLMKENGISLKSGWRAMIAGKVIDAKTPLKPGCIIKVANTQKNG